MLRHTLAWLRRSRHRKLLRTALAQPAAEPPPLEALRSLAERHVEPWAGRLPPTRAAFEAGLRRLHEEHPSIHVFDVDGRRVLARRKTGRAARHAVAAIDARMYAKRVNHYGTLLAEVLRGRDGWGAGAAERFSLAVDLRDIPHDDPALPVFAFQRRLGGGNPLLPDVDFFHHRWYLDDHDPTPYDAKTISACFAGASTGRALSADDVRGLASERLALAAAFHGNRRVVFRIASAVHCVDAEAEALLRAQPWFGAPIPWGEQLRHRFLISVDGNGATCSRVVKALRSQGVLLKFASAYELYYFPLLEPDVHYRPARTAADVERALDEEAAEPGRHRAMSQAATAFAQRVLGARAVVAYSAALVERYAAVFPRR